MKIKETTIFDEHQKAGALFLLKRNVGFLNYATGSGKSLIAIMVMFYLIKNNISNKCIIVSQKSGLISIYEDFIEHTDHIPVIIEKLPDLLLFLKSNKEHIAIANYNLIKDCISFVKSKNSLKEELNEKLVSALKNIQLSIIFDEFHTLKNKGSATTKYWTLLRPFMQRCYGVTASSYFQDIEDIFYLAAFLDKTFFKNITAFRNAYCTWLMKPIYGSKKLIPVIVGHKNLDQLKEKLEEIMLYYTPILNVKYHVYDIALSDNREYVKAAKGFYDLATGKKVDKKAWSARLPDLQRVVNNDKNKAMLFNSVISGLKTQGFIVYCALLDSVDLVKEQLTKMEIEFQEITGAVSSKNRKKYKDWFNSNPANKCLIISDAGGQSLNLQSVNNLVCFDLPFGIGKFIQIRGRIVRQFSKHDIFNIHVVLTKKTIDEYKYTRITQQEQAYHTLFGLSVANDTAEFTDFNQYIIDNLKSEFLWVKE